MSSVYAKFLAESAYKHSVDKPHTGNGIAFYEEPGRTSHRVDLDAIWTDSKYIPIVAPELDEAGFYTVTEGSLSLKILQRLEDIPLDKVDGTEATYKSVYLVDSIFPSYGTGYSIKITDWNYEEIPFGLNQWVIDPDNGEITFLGGWPEGYQENPRISFYRYVGRKASENFLRADGSVKMISGYKPTTEQDIATKGYVDSVTGDVSNIVSKLVPTLPPTLDMGDLSLSYDRDIYASPWNSNTKMPVVFIGEDYKIMVPQFYNPGRGEFHVNVNGFDILDVDLATIGGPGIHDYWTITSVVDPYRNSKVANGFYKSINSYITLPEESIKSLISDKIPFITLYCYTYYDFKKIASNPITIGFEKKFENAYIGTYKMHNLQSPDKDNSIKYISGVPTLREGSSLTYEYSVKDMAHFKNDYSGKFTVENISEVLIESDSLYPTVYPTQNISKNIIIPNGLSQEELNIDIIANTVELVDNISTSKNYNIRIDTKSDESNRKISPVNFVDTYLSENWTEEKAREDLTVSSELQMLYGKYQWPTGNYTQNGNFKGLEATDDISLKDIIAGPDYTKIINGVRFVTFAFDMPFCNGFWISFKDGENITSDKDTHAFNNISQLRCSVENQTGWLNMKKPFEGILSPRDNDEGCLVVQSSTESTKYVTFGQEPLEGRLNITIGINRESSIKFSGVEIVFNQ